MTDSIFELIMTIGRDIFLENHVSRNFILKCYITILLQQFTKTLNKFLNLCRINESLEICTPVLFDQLNESKQFWGTFFG